MTPTQKAAMEQAEKWLAWITDGTVSSPPPFGAVDVLSSIRAALAETAEPVAYIHRQGNHWEVAERHLTDDEKARGWAEEPLYTAPQPLAPAQADMDTQAGELLKAFAGYHGPGVSGILRSAQPPAPAPEFAPDTDLLALADKIDHEQNWRLSGIDQRDQLTQDQRDRLLAGVMLRRYADIMAPDSWRIFPPKHLRLVATAFRASTLEKAVEMVRADLKRHGKPEAQTPAPAVEPVAGWKLVPVEPTDEMCEEGLEDEGHTIRDGKAYADALYRAMIATAPQPPAPAQTAQPVAHENWYDPDSCAFCGLVGGHSKKCRNYTAPQPPAPAVGDGDLAIAYMAGYHAAKKAPAVEWTPPTGMKVADVGFVWDGETQLHTPKVVVYFEPVPANSPANSKGWQDRDAFVALVSSARARAAIAAHEKKRGGA